MTHDRGSAEAPNDNDDIVDNNQDIVDELPVESVLGKFQLTILYIK